VATQGWWWVFRVSSFWQKYKNILAVKTHSSKIKLSAYITTPQDPKVDRRQSWIRNKNISQIVHIFPVVTIWMRRWVEMIFLTSPGVRRIFHHWRNLSIGKTQINYRFARFGRIRGKRTMLNTNHSPKLICASHFQNSQAASEQMVAGGEIARGARICRRNRWKSWDKRGKRN
jgi:hypothetical protein